MSSLSSVEAPQSRHIEAEHHGDPDAAGDACLPDASTVLVHSASQPVVITPKTRSRATSTSSDSPFSALTDSPPRTMSKSLSHVPSQLSRDDIVSSMSRRHFSPISASKTTSSSRKSPFSKAHGQFTVSPHTVPRARSRSRSPGSVSHQKSPKSQRKSPQSDRDHRRDSQPSSAFQGQSPNHCPTTSPLSTPSPHAKTHKRVRSKSIGHRQETLMKQLSDARPKAHNVSFSPTSSRIPPDASRPLSTSATMANIYSPSTSSSTTDTDGTSPHKSGSRTLPRTRPPLSNKAQSSPATPAHKVGPITTPLYSDSNYHNRNGFFGHGQDHDTATSVKDLSSLSPRSKTVRHRPSPASTTSSSSSNGTTTTSASGGYFPLYHESLSRASGRGRAAAGSRRAASPRSLPSETSADGEQRGGGGGVYRRGYGSLSRSSSLHEEMSIRDILAVTPEDLYREVCVGRGCWEVLIGTAAVAVRVDQFRRIFVALRPRFVLSFLVQFLITVDSRFSPLVRSSIETFGISLHRSRHSISISNDHWIIRD